MPSLLLENRKVSYSSTGSGTPVVFIHGSFATSSAWRKVVANLDSASKCAIAVDLPGWGDSEAVPLDPARLLEHEGNAIEAVLNKEAADPAQLVAHSYGAVIALWLALAGRVSIRSLTLFEPLPLTFLRDTGDAKVVEDMLGFVAEYRRVFQSGDEWAARRVIELWGGKEAFAAMPAQVREFVKAGTAQNLCQWDANFHFCPSVEDYKSLRVPITLVRGEKSHPVSRLICERLHALLPMSDLVDMPGASHFMIHTHAAECARIIG